MAESVPSTITKNLYELLEVDKNASEAEIKSNYRKLALQFHPDRNRGKPGAEDHFKKLATAYTILSDPNQRRLYDVSSKDGTNADVFQGLQPIDVNEMNGLGRMLGYEPSHLTEIKTHMYHIYHILSIEHFARRLAFLYQRKSVRTSSLQPEVRQRIGCRIYNIYVCG
jgi:curved DNA-binding protein CbpA